MTILIIFALTTAFVVAYILWLRPWLREKPWTEGFFEAIEPIEIFLWRKSETILWARFKMLVGVLLTVLTSLGQIDLTPLLPFIPDAYEDLVRGLINLSPLLIVLLGWIDEKLRKDTTQPLDVVSAPQAVRDATPEVAKMESANAAAVVAVKEAEAQQGAA